MIASPGWHGGHHIRSPFGVSQLQVSGGGSGMAIPAVSRSSSARLGAAFQGFPAVLLFPGSESFSSGSGGSPGWEHPALGHPLPRAPSGAQPVLCTPGMQWAPSYSSNGDSTLSLPTCSWMDFAPRPGTFQSHTALGSLRDSMGLRSLSTRQQKPCGAGGGRGTSES